MREPKIAWVERNVTPSPNSFHSAMQEVDNTFRPSEESSSVGGQPSGSDVDVNLQESATAETGTNEDVVMN